MATAPVEIVTIVEEVNGHPFPLMFVSSERGVEEFEKEHGFTWEAWFRAMGWKAQSETEVPPFADRWYIGIAEDRMFIHDSKATQPMPFSRPSEHWVEAARQVRAVMCFVATDATPVTESDGWYHTKDNCIGALVPIGPEAPGLRT